MEIYKPVTHVLFDVDGLLLDSEKIYTEMTNRICGQFGKEFTWEIKVKVMGKKEQDSARIIIDELQLPIAHDEYMRQLQAFQEEMMPHVELLPGAERLVRHLHAHGIPMALVTGSDDWSFGCKVRIHGDLFGLFHHQVLISSDPEVKRGKPAPDGFIIAAQRFKDSPSPEKVLVFEDAINGMIAGLAANMQVVWVPDARARSEHHDRQATLVLDSLEDFNPALFGLPPYP